MISRRFLVPLALVLVVAFLPTLRHGYIGYAVAADPLTPAALPASLGERAGRDRPRTAAWMRSTYAAESWAERAYEVPGAGTLNLFVVRSLDHKKLYHHPELGVLRGRSFAPVRSAALPDGRVVHVLENVTGEGESAVYGFQYGDDWIANPYFFQLRSSVTQLWTGRRPLTLVLVYGMGALQQGQPSPAAAALLTAVSPLPPGN